MPPEKLTQTSSLGVFRMQKTFGKKRKASSQEMSLNITAMADIFTILLVFLLKSFASGAMNITPSAGLILPEAEAASAEIEALKVEISREAISLEETPVVTLINFQFPSGEILGNQTSKTLSSALEKQRKRQLLIAKSNEEVKVDSKIIVIADEGAPYSTIKSVLASAAVHGFTDFKLAVIKSGD